MASETDVGLTGKIVEWGWTVIAALLGLVYAMHNKRMDKIEASIGIGDKANETEIDRQRDNIAKIFDKLEQHSQRAEDRHREILTALHVGLAGKADK